MKRLTAVIFAFVFLLTSCGGNESPLNSKSAVTITLWHYYHGVQQTALDDFIKEYNTTEGLEKGIIVEAISYGGVNDLDDAVYSSARGEAGAPAMPDLFNSYSDSAYKLAEMNKLADLSKYFTAEETDAYISSYIRDGYFYNNAFNVFPVAKSSEALMLNKTDWDKFEEAVNSNPDYENVSVDMLKSWEGILKASELYYNWTDSSGSETGKALFGFDYAANFFFAGAAQLGCEFINPSDGNVSLDADILRKLWDTYYVPMVKGYFNALGRFRSDDVKTGDILCFVGSTASASYFPLHINPAEGDSYDIEAYVGVYPVFTGGENAVIQQGAGMCIAKSDEVHEYAAAEFLKWFTAPERNMDFAIKSAGYFPVTNEAMDKLTESAASMNPDGKSEKILSDVLKTGISQINTFKLYNTPAFDATESLRTAFDALKAKALSQRTALLEKAGDSEAYQAALEEMTGDNEFNDWVDELNKLFK